MYIGNFGDFFPFYPPENLQNQNFGKVKKLAGDIIILHMCTKKHNHLRLLIYGVKGTKFFVILGYFCSFTSLTTWTIEKKQHLQISLFYKCVPKITIIWCTYDFWDIESNRQFFAIWCHFVLFTLLTNWEIKILKKW